jgi:hypothetical protein
LFWNQEITFKVQGLKPGAFKLWVNLYTALTLVGSNGGIQVNSLNQSRVAVPSSSLVGPAGPSAPPANRRNALGLRRGCDSWLPHRRAARGAAALGLTPRCRKAPWRVVRVPALCHVTPPCEAFVEDAMARRSTGGPARIVDAISMMCVLRKRGIPYLV